MEGVQSAFRKISEDGNFVQGSSLDPSSSSAPLPPPPELAPWSSMPSNALVSRPPRHLVSLWTCSKLCAVCFVAGIFVGYTLKRRVRRWLSRLLKRLKDD